MPSSNNMYEKITSDVSNESYDNYANNGQKFVAWYLRNIYSLTPVEARECITDGAGDKQIDAVYIDDEAQTIHIIQGKFYGRKTIDAEPLWEVLSSWTHLKNLQSLQENANDRLKSKIQDISQAMSDDYRVSFELVTTASLSPEANKDVMAFQKQITEDDSMDADLIVVDNDVLSFRYDEALNRDRPYIHYDFKLEPDKFMELTINNTKAVIAAIPLKECITIPGIKDGSLFRKNVRQSLGTSNKVNKGIAKTLKSDAGDFFFYHNGITAICSKMSLEGNILHTSELNVVNGCQSLNTIYNSSEAVKNSDGYIMFKIYEISDSQKSDNISTNTNSQSAVKARDLRSNDKNVLAMKKAFENRYPDGYFKTKRGEKIDDIKYNTAHVIDLTDLGKELMAWHSQRPTMSYSETRIFDKYFNQLFHKDYDPENMLALKEMFDAITAKWTQDNPMDLNPALLAMRSYARYHHLYAISALVDEINGMNSSAVPNPAKTYSLMQKNDLIQAIIDMTGSCLNAAFETASSEAKDNDKIFSAVNWSKNKGSLRDIRSAISAFMTSLKTFNKDNYNMLKDSLAMNPSDFEDRWTAD